MPSLKTGGGKIEKRKFIEVKELKPEYKVVETYWVIEPFAKVYIVENPEYGGFQYFVDEVKLNEREQKAKDKIIDILGKELEPPESIEIDPSSYVLREAQRIAVKYRRTLGKFDEESWKKIFYHVSRDLAGYGELNVLFRDPEIEDISCNGVYMPVYVWHRKYESIPTNISFVDEVYYDNYIIKLVHFANEHISSARPILDATLPEGHRLATTFMREVSTAGSTFCIRKFRSDPLSIVDLINYGTLNAEIAAYLWLLLENKMSLMIIGGTGAGKTSTLNALLSLIPQNHKIITIEEVAELNPPHENRVQFISRKGYRFGSTETTEITLFDLVKLSLRYRPDYIVVGEVRGEEAYVLFQALATGHGGLCTMHADSLEHAVRRLTSPPMNIAEIYVPLMNLGIYVARTDLPRKKLGLTYGRRIRKIQEIIDYEKYNTVAEWLPLDDDFETNFKDSFLLDVIAIRRGVKKKAILEDLKEREEMIMSLVKAGIRRQSEVAKAIMEYRVKKITEATSKVKVKGKAAV